jgi:NADH:ubiquinone oxidoreductase subunit K
MKRAAVTLTVFAGSFVIFALLFVRFPIIHDGDSYFHLAAASLYLDGVPSELPWARYSVMHDGWGDKEILFHVFLAPFTLLEDAALGGRLALATLNAILFTLLTALGWRAIGPWGSLLGGIVYLLQPDFFNRAFRLRPELMAVTLLVILIYSAGRRRHLVVAVAAFAFALSYTAAQVPVGLAVFWVLWDRFYRGKWDVRPAVAVTSGVALALLVHPHFPKNLEIWWIQNVRFFEFRDRLDVGEEIFAPSLATLAAGNAGIVLALVALWFASRETGERRDDESTGPYFAISAGAFLVLYLMMGRMVTWAAPLASMAVVFGLARSGRVPTGWLEVGRLRVPLALVLVAALAAAFPGLADPSFIAMLRSPENVISEAELERFGESVPNGARVAATWREGEVYAFFAPGASYLNVLDPIFMALPYPREFEAQKAIFDGTEPDIPLALVTVLDSDYIAFDRSASPPVFFERISRDPRFEVTYSSYNVLAAVRPDSSFVLDWKKEDGRAWPRVEIVSAREFEGFVDLHRLGVTEGCATLTHDLTLGAPEEITWNFSPWGTGHVEIDGQATGFVRAPARAVLGAGARISAELDEGAHRIDVTTCGDRGVAGFYLRLEKRMRIEDIASWSDARQGSR